MQTNSNPRGRLTNSKLRSNGRYQGNSLLAATATSTAERCEATRLRGSYSINHSHGCVPSMLPFLPCVLLSFIRRCWSHPLFCSSIWVSLCPSVSLSLSVSLFVRSFVCHNIHRTLSLSSQQFLFPLTFWHSNSDSKPTNVTSVQDAQLEPSLFRLIALTIFALALPLGIAAVVRCETTYRAPPLPVKHCFKESHILIHPLILPPSPSQL